ncbi:MAG TPA: SurA N-terminal domain-containing protein [Terriglobales bacterium]|nr:SurA N-terminal domain-containing protein [Terriglobales bacterium]
MMNCNLKSKSSKQRDPTVSLPSPLRHSLLTVLVALSAVCAFGQETQTIDRIVATVNHQPVLQSEWEDALRFEGFLQGRPPETFAPQEREQALNRLIDRVLLAQQMQADYSATPQELADREDEIRSQLQGAETDKGWQELLHQYGLTDAAFDAALENQLTVMHFIELRLRPSVRVSRQDVEDYYNQTLVPAVKKSGKEPESLDVLRPRIRELLVQKQMDSVLEDWLANLRSQSGVHIIPENSDAERSTSGATVKDQK